MKFGRDMYKYKIKLGLEKITTADYVNTFVLNLDFVWFLVYYFDYAELFNLYIYFNYYINFDFNHAYFIL